MKLWPVAPFFHSLLVGFSFWKENPTKSEWKKRGNRSEFHSEINYYLQNWYFSESPLVSISVFPITHPLLCSILHVAKKNVQLYMPNLNRLAKSTGNVDRKYSPIYLGIWLFLQNEKRVSLKCTSLQRKILWINIQMLFFYAKNNNCMVIKMESGQTGPFQTFF